MGDVFPEIRAKQKTIKETIRREEEAFNRTLDRGIELFEGAVRSKHRSCSDLGYHVDNALVTAEQRVAGSRGVHESALERLVPKRGFGLHTIAPLNGRKSLTEHRICRDAFKLYDTYGFPLDLTELMARERGLTVDVAGFEKLMEQQRERARKAQKKEKKSASKRSS